MMLNGVLGPCVDNAIRERVGVSSKDLDLSQVPSHRLVLRIPIVNWIPQESELKG